MKESTRTAPSKEKLILFYIPSSLTLGFPPPALVFPQDPYIKQIKDCAGGSRTQVLSSPLVWCLCHPGFHSLLLQHQFGHPVQDMDNGSCTGKVLCSV